MNIPFHITPTTSVFTDTANDHAFDLDNPGADTLIVDPGAYLISANSANSGDGAFLANTGAWTVTVNGSIVSQSLAGIVLQAGNAALSTITIGVDGEVQGGFDGILLGDGPATIKNAGQISGGTSGIGIAFGGTHTIINSGTITGGIADVGGSTDTVRNSGQIFGNLSLGFGNDTVTNTGTITGNIDLGHDTNRLTNSGQVFGNVTAGDGSDTVTNFAIVGDVMKSGTIAGTISLGAGNDTFTGGANPEIVKDDDGADTISLGGGNDTYIATGSSGADGVDTIGGGAGIDTYDASGAGIEVRINLDTVAHDFTPILPGTGLLAANTAIGTDIAGRAKDMIAGFENAKGGAGFDDIFGSAAANTLEGGGGGDSLFGFGGNDTLIGGAGIDGLAGGAGKDTLTGGPDPDQFQYFATSDSGITAATRDLIADFQPGDKIDLHLIDANKTNAAGTDDAFTFIGTNTPFTGSPGQLHAFWSAIGQIIEGDVNGDKKADFSIEIADPTHAITLTNTSFFL